MARKINLRVEKTIKNEEYAIKYRKYNSKEDRKKARAKRVREREAKWWEDYYAPSLLAQKSLNLPSG